MISTQSQAADENALPALSGYDAVSYFNQKEPVRGSGMHVHRHQGQDYLFSTAENLAEFKKNPEKYLPKYGGFCAFGAAMGKKFHADPTVYSVVDGSLYLNLNKDIQMKWNDKQAQLIKDADQNWKKIRTQSSDKL
jgi:YHS domain-containing protein